MRTLVLLWAIAAAGRVVQADALAAAANAVLVDDAVAAAAAAVTRNKASAALGAGGYSLTAAQLTSLSNGIESAIYSIVELDSEGAPYLPCVGGFVRLAFHQCVSGRCNGCINVNDPNNAHLDRFIGVLEKVRRRQPYASRADLWTLAGIVALRVGERLANQRYHTTYAYTQRLQFRYGRRDCPTAPYTSAVYELPNFAKGLDYALAFFRKRFAFSDVDTVALMGVHRLGGLRSPATGQLVYQWGGPADALDNAYYRVMADAGQSWYQSAHALATNSKPAYFWTSSVNGRRFMFNTDMCLYKNLTFVSGDVGQARCTYATCRPSPTAFLIKLYADSNDLWMIAFVPAYTKFTEYGYASGALKTA